MWTKEVKAASTVGKSQFLLECEAKLGDFSSANFLAKLGTVGPGCVAYAAPEAVDPRQTLSNDGRVQLSLCNTV